MATPGVVITQPEDYAKFTRKSVFQLQWTATNANTLTLSIFKDRSSKRCYCQIIDAQDYSFDLSHWLSRAAVGNYELTLVCPGIKVSHHFVVLNDVNDDIYQPEYRSTGDNTMIEGNSVTSISELYGNTFPNGSVYYNNTINTSFIPDSTQLTKTHCIISKKYQSIRIDRSQAGHSRPINLNSSLLMHYKQVCLPNNSVQHDDHPPLRVYNAHQSQSDVAKTQYETFGGNNENELEEDTKEQPQMDDGYEEGYEEGAEIDDGHYYDEDPNYQGPITEEKTVPDEIAYYDENGNYDPNGNYDENGNYVGEANPDEIAYYDENGNYDPNGTYDENGNYVGEANPDEIAYYDENGNYDPNGTYDENGNYVGEANGGGEVAYYDENANYGVNENENQTYGGFEGLDPADNVQGQYDPYYDEYIPPQMTIEKISHDLAFTSFKSDQRIYSIGDIKTEDLSRFQGCCAPKKVPLEIDQLDLDYLFQLGYLHYGPNDRNETLDRINYSIYTFFTNTDEFPEYGDPKWSVLYPSNNPYDTFDGGVLSPLCMLHTIESDSILVKNLFGYSKSYSFKIMNTSVKITMISLRLIRERYLVNKINEKRNIFLAFKELYKSLLYAFYKSFEEHKELRTEQEKYSYLDKICNENCEKIITRYCTETSMIGGIAPNTKTNLV